MFRKRKARDWTAREGRSGERSPQVEAVWRERWTGGTGEHSWAGAGAVREGRLLKFFLFLLERQSFSLLYLRSVHSTNMYWLCASAKHGGRCQGRGRDSQRWDDVKCLEFSEKDSVDTDAYQTGWGWWALYGKRNLQPSMQGSRGVKKGRRTPEVQGKQKWL